MTRLFIAGAAGTTGREPRRRLAARADLAVVELPEEHRRDPAARADALNGADIVILCLPDEAAREAVALIRNPATRVIDASTAYRTDPAWTYGFPELEPGGRERVTAARRVSNPGCYPTGFLALVRPLVRAGLVPADMPLTVNATSGFSGGGKAMIAEFEGAGDDAPAFRPYALALGHKHLAEMRVHGGLFRPPVFLPAVARAYRGMLVEVPLHLDQLHGALTLGLLRACLADAYAGAALVRVSADQPATIAIEHAAGSDRLDLFVCGSDRLGQARLVAALDNLGKGAAGAAVQSLNLMTGARETEGLRP